MKKASKKLVRIIEKALSLQDEKAIRDAILYENPSLSDKLDKLVAKAKARIAYKNVQREQAKALEQK